MDMCSSIYLKENVNQTVELFKYLKQKQCKMILLGLKK